MYTGPNLPRDPRYSGQDNSSSNAPWPARTRFKKPTYIYNAIPNFEPLWSHIGRKTVETAKIPGTLRFTIKWLPYLAPLPESFLYMKLKKPSTASQSSSPSSLIQIGRSRSSQSFALPKVLLWSWRRGHSKGVVPTRLRLAHHPTAIALSKPLSLPSLVGLGTRRLETRPDPGLCSSQGLLNSYNDTYAWTKLLSNQRSIDLCALKCPLHLAVEAIQPLCVLHQEWLVPGDLEVVRFPGVANIVVHFGADGAINGASLDEVNLKRKRGQGDARAQNLEPQGRQLVSVAWLATAAYGRKFRGKTAYTPEGRVIEYHRRFTGFERTWRTPTSVLGHWMGHASQQQWPSVAASVRVVGVSAEVTVSVNTSDVTRVLAGPSSGDSVDQGGCDAHSASVVSMEEANAEGVPTSVAAEALTSTELDMGEAPQGDGQQSNEVSQEMELDDAAPVPCKDLSLRVGEITTFKGGELRWSGGLGTPRKNGTYMVTEEEDHSAVDAFTPIPKLALRPKWFSYIAALAQLHLLLARFLLGEIIRSAGGNHSSAMKEDDDEDLPDAEKPKAEVVGLDVSTYSHPNILRMDHELSKRLIAVLASKAPTIKRGGIHKLLGKRVGAGRNSGRGMAMGKVNYWRDEVEDKEDEDDEDENEGIEEEENVI
ncbi:hypothetical protein L211DRAFT_854221 [Terfezia boudieri ATCC MYA-4762]|uniref:Uncharacterized protein n=1 Tax=Terfezia boudieri ATCC MYA-4762 TaxID=1051890 RepID=A0A3N4LCE4_9PEZI|nr:hypothetical protein L211DRAFT_854221 [Terfezia boudieri ATCC MYA-4762]